MSLKPFNRGIMFLQAESSSAGLVLNGEKCVTLQALEHVPSSAGLVVNGEKCVTLQTLEHVPTKSELALMPSVGLERSRRKGAGEVMVEVPVGTDKPTRQ